MSTTSRILITTLAALTLAACTTSTVVRPAAQTTRPPASRASVPAPGATAVVKRGDTLYGIAFRNGLDVRELAEWNGIGSPYTIYPGQRLRLSPRVARAAANSSRPAASAALPRTAAPPRAVPPGAPATAGTTPREAATPGTTLPATPANRTAAPAPKPPSPPPASDLAWRWPVQGQLLSRFVAGEPTRQGIDIAGEAGAPVHAAADGVVVYSGSGLVGYGELIIVKHSDAWLSAYGHNRARMVNEGTIVKAGQQIAVMGRTGAPRDMLHFEIRHNGKPVDPLTYLPRR